MDCKVILPNACWVEPQNDSVILVSVPCDDVSSIVMIDFSGKRSKLCFMIGSVVKTENNKLFHNKNKLEECNSEE